MIEAEKKKATAAHKKHGPHPVNQKALRRLKNIEGQVRGLQRMLEGEKYCVDSGAERVQIIDELMSVLAKEKI
jgi:DNA-binding FrmR family transcriptional regulator